MRKTEKTVQRSNLTKITEQGRKTCSPEICLHSLRLNICWGKPHFYSSRTSVMQANRAHNRRKKYISFRCKNGVAVAVLVMGARLQEGSSYHLLNLLHHLPKGSLKLFSFSSPSLQLQ